MLSNQSPTQFQLRVSSDLKNHLHKNKLPCNRSIHQIIRALTIAPADGRGGDMIIITLCVRGHTAGEGHAGLYVIRTYCTGKT
jgi:hypothetical protein